MKRYLVGIVFLSMLAALMLTGCASTQQQAMTPETRALCAALDTNHDGKITKEEFMAQATDKNKALEVFQKCDTGNKGYLSYNEVISQRQMIPPEITMTPPPLVRPVR
jgi:Ca2+-binding EF-hand superfamily protein